MLRIVLIILTASLTSSAFAQESDTKFVELLNKKVDVLESPYGRSQIFEETIDTAGFSEIRMFIHVFAENYKEDPVTKQSLINATLFHNVSNGSWAYSHKAIKSDVTSYINGWFSEKIIGNKTRIVASGRDLPKGPYTIIVTYYLVE